jgi:hypothetical protein
MTIRDPESKFSSVWDALQVIFLFYVSWTVPLRACFGIEIEIPSPEWVIDSVVDLYFIADLMLNFSTAFVDGNGIRQTSRRGKLSSTSLAPHCTAQSTASCTLDETSSPGAEHN